jgi:hypothetical protein
MLDDVASEDAFAEKLSLWIHFVDADTLFAVHNTGIAEAKSMHTDAALAANADAADNEFRRVQTLLMNSIINGCTPNSGKSIIKLPMPELSTEATATTTAIYKPYHQFYEAHQRDMTTSIQSLRINVRKAVAKMSPKLKKLADLDATFEKILRDRESKLLSKVPVLLKKRFEQLFKEHQQRLAAAQEFDSLDSPKSWVQEGGWLSRFCKDMQMLLLAEMELRLQPTMGLLEALKQETQ